MVVVIDDFEDGDVDEYMVVSGSMAIATSPVYEGTYSGEIGGVSTAISMDVSDPMPQRGDTFRAYIHMTEGEFERASPGLIFGATGTGSSYDGYQVRGEGGLYRVDGGGTSWLGSGPSIPTGEWGEIEVEFNDTIVCRWYDSTGSEVGSVSATDTTYDGTGFGYMNQVGVSGHVDYARFPDKTASVTVTESSSVGASASMAVSESVVETPTVVSESMSVSASASQSTTEVAHANESATIQVPTNISFEGGVTVSEQASIVASLSPSVTESASATEEASIQASGGASVAETAVAGERVSMGATSRVPTIVDTSVAAEDVSLSASTDTGMVEFAAARESTSITASTNVVIVGTVGDALRQLYRIRGEWQRTRIRSGTYSRERSERGLWENEHDVDGGT